LLLASTFLPRFDHDPSKRDLRIFALMIQDTKPPSTSPVAVLQVNEKHQRGIGELPLRNINLRKVGFLPETP
jgi:hypothetical protein